MARDCTLCYACRNTGDRGWIFAEVMNRLEDLGDGKIYEEPNLTILHYAGNGLFKYEEDAYNPHNMGVTIGAWIQARKALGAAEESKKD